MNSAGENIANDPNVDFLTSVYWIGNQQRMTKVQSQDIFRGKESLSHQAGSSLEKDPRITVRRLHSYFQPASPNQKGVPRLTEGQGIEVLLRARHLALTSLVRCPLHPFVRLPLIKTDFLRLSTKLANEGPLFNLQENAHRQLTQQLADDTMRLQPQNEKIIGQLARLTFVFPGPKESIPFLRRMLQIRPQKFNELLPLLQEASGNDAGHLANLIPPNFDAMLAIAESEVAAKALQEILLDRVAAKLNAENSRAVNPLTDAERAFFTARIATQRGAPGLAIESLEDAVRLAPGNTSFRNRLVDLLVEQDQFSDAIKHLQRSMIQQPQNTALPQKLKRIHQQQKEHMMQ